MNLYPAIDLFEGQVVRLKRGDYNAKTVYSENPADMANQWQDQGAQWIHVVDLEGAKTGVLKNLKSIQAIRKTFKGKMQFGGGVRSYDIIRQLTEEGLDRVVVGTRALDDIFLTEILDGFSSKIAAGLDVKDGIVRTQGWMEDGGLTLNQALNKFRSTSLETIIYTDISKDGMLQGPNFERLKDVLAKSKARVILSGGVSSLEDIKKCRSLDAANFEGAIIGKALYDQKIKLKDAIALAQS